MRCILALTWLAAASNQPRRLADANIERAIAAKAAALRRPEGAATFLPDRISGGPDRELVLDTATWRDTDGMCCPTGTGKIVFTVAGGKLMRR